MGRRTNLHKPAREPAPGTSLASARQAVYSLALSRMVDKDLVLELAWNPKENCFSIKK